MSHLAPHDEDADPLDDLIRRSVRGDVDRLALDRLEQRWHAAMGEQQRVFPMWTLAAAACLAILAGTLGLFVLWPDKEVVEGNKPEDGVTSGRVVAMDNGPPDDQTQVTDSSPPGRDLSPELTPYERLLVQKAFQQLPATTTESSRLLRRELVHSLAALETVDDESSARLAE